MSASARKSPKPSPQFDLDRVMACEPPPLLIERFVQEHDASPTEAREGFEETKKFLVACAKNRFRQSLVPTVRVDEMWHSFILFSQDYSRFCDLLGGYIHHVPSPPGMDGKDENILHTLTELIDLFGEINTDWWGGFVDYALVAQAIEEAPSPVSETELQAAADAFRRKNGLYSAAETRRWLKKMGLSVAQFQESLRWQGQVRKLTERVTARQIESYFQAHRESFDTVQFFRSDTPTESVARQLVKAARVRGLFEATRARIARGEDLEGALISQRTHELPSALATAAPGAVVGPVREESWFWVAEMLSRQPAELDAQTRAMIQEQLFQNWLTERRKKMNDRRDRCSHSKGEPRRL